MKRNFYVFFSLQDFSNLFWSKIPRRFFFPSPFSLAGTERLSQITCWKSTIIYRGVLSLTKSARVNETTGKTFDNHLFNSVLQHFLQKSSDETEIDLWVVW